MSTLTLEIDPSLALAMEESARREHKPVAAWAQERLRLAAMETEAEAHGYPSGWMRLFGCIDDATFQAPVRTSARSISGIEEA